MEKESEATLAHVNVRFAIVRQKGDRVFIDGESLDTCKQLIGVFQELQKRIDRGEKLRDFDEIPRVITGNPETVREEMDAIGAQMENLSQGKLSLEYISEPLQRLRLPSRANLQQPNAAEADEPTRAH